MAIEASHRECSPDRSRLRHAVAARTPPRADVLPYLRRCVDRSRKIPEFQIMADAEQDVVGRFGAAFRPENLDDLTAETVTDFLREKVNHHWYGLERKTPRVTANMSALREGMAVLLDDSAPLAERWDAALPRMHGGGKAIASAMLLVVFPAKCGGGTVSAARRWPGSV